MKRIWKRALKLTQHQDVELPIGAKIIHVAEQDGNICLWFICDSTAKLEVKQIQIAGTGQEAPNGDYYRYLGTAMLAKGLFVWHVFEKL